MSGGSFSLVEKLAVTVAFCALVAMAVGTEDDPGVVAQTQQDMTAQSGSPILHNDPPLPIPAPPPPPVAELAAPPPLAPPVPTPAPVQTPAPQPTTSALPVPDGAFDPELGRVPIDMRAVNANM